MRRDHSGSPSRRAPLHAASTPSRPFLNVAASIELACQPSPRRATRRNAPSLLPPTHSGGRGFWRGIGGTCTSAREWVGVSATRPTPTPPHPHPSHPPHHHLPPP